MTKDSIIISATFPVSPERLYTDWLNSAGHTIMTGGEAHCEPVIGSPFTAWDGYIQGSVLALEPHSRIVQSWRTSEFNSTDDDSQIEITLSETEQGTEFTIVHTNIPEGDGQKYNDGWKQFYIEPMTAYYF